jgi:hypothetical protein
MARCCVGRIHAQGLLMLTRRVGDYFVRGAPAAPKAEARGVLRALIIYIVRVS